MDYSSFVELVDKYFETGDYDPGIMAFNLIDLNKLKEKYPDNFIPEFCKGISQVLLWGRYC